MSTRNRSLLFLLLAVLLGLSITEWGFSAREAFSPVPVASSSVEARERADLESLVESEAVHERAEVASTIEPKLANAVQPAADVELEEPFVFWCQLVAEGSGLPVRGATVAHRPGLLHAQNAHTPRGVLTFAEESDAFGFAKLRIQFETSSSTSDHSSNPFCMARVDAPGFGPALLIVRKGHETAERALKIQLKQSATLTVRIVDAGGAPIPYAVVKLKAPPYTVIQPEGTFIFGDDVEWSEMADELGRCTLAELPAETPLTASAWSRTERLHREPSDLVLKPDEQRELVWTVGAGTELTGWLIDQYDQPVVNREVWLTRGAMNSRVGSERFYFYAGDKREIVAQVQTDLRGRFRFRDVAPGEWFVGPSALDVFEATDNPNEVAPLASSVSLTAGTSNHEVRLRVQRGLFIKGRVSKPNGQLTENPYVRVTCELGYIEARRWPDIWSKGAEFICGPVDTVEHTFHAVGRGMLGPSKAVTVWPGEDDVRLQLCIGGKVSGRILDAQTAEECAAIVTTSLHGSASIRISTPAQLGFQSDGQKPGLYDFAARTPDGRTGVLRDVRLDSGQILEDLEIRVEPGAQVRVHYTGPYLYTQYRVVSGGSIVSTNGVRRGTSRLESVPTGEITVRLFCRNELLEERIVECTLGEEAEVVFEL